MELRVLVLDDDPIQLQVERNWLRANGHEVAVATNGRAAIEALGSGRIDVAVLDWMVPDLSGQDVLRWARQRGMALPIMFATSCGEEFDVASILALGADDYVVKPLRSMEFVARVEALARRVRGLGITERGYTR
jgi:DNA-binding response OmpR family regulator